MRILMVITSVGAFYINKAFSKARYSNKDDFDFEQPLTNLVWITSILSIVVTFVVSYYVLGPGSGVAASCKNSGWYFQLSLAVVPWVQL